MEFDLYFDDIQLAIEYQGLQHYYDTFIYGDNQKVTSRDEQKAFICGMRMLTLIEVPWWWSESVDELNTTISFVRPGSPKIFVSPSDDNESSLKITGHKYIQPIN